MGYSNHSTQDIVDALADAGITGSARTEVLRALGVSTPKTRTLKVVIESDTEYSRNETLDSVIRDALGDLDGVQRVKTASVHGYRWKDDAFEAL